MTVNDNARSSTIGLNVTAVAAMPIAAKVFKLNRDNGSASDAELDGILLMTLTARENRM